MKYRYTGTDERVFPSLGLVVKPGDEFDAPENFSAANVVLATAKIPTKSPEAKAGE
jgi:hypothetical protein